MKTFVNIINWFVRVYAVITIGLIGLYLYQKYLLDFEDIIETVPVVFLENSYNNVDTIFYYSLVAPVHQNAALTVRNTLFCENRDGLWEREIEPDPTEYRLEFDQKRLDKLQMIKAELELSAIELIHCQ